MQYQSILRTGRLKYFLLVILFTLFLSPIIIIFPPAILSWGILIFLVTISRLRDVDWNSALVLITIVPIINIIFIIILCLVPGTPGPNKYGPTPEVFFMRRKELRKQGYSYKNAAKKIFEETNFVQYK